MMNRMNTSGRETAGTVKRKETDAIGKMRQYSMDGAMIIGVDHGYGNIKTAHYTFPTCVLESEKPPVLSKDYLEYDGKYHIIGEGHKDFVADKVEDNDYYILTLAAVAKEMKERGLSVAQKGKHFDGSRMEEGSITAWSKDKYNLFTGNAKDSFLMECGIAVLSTMEDCASREEFIWKLAEKGWKVNWTENRKHITFENKEGKKVSKGQQPFKDFPIKNQQGGFRE